MRIVTVVSIVLFCLGYSHAGEQVDTVSSLQNVYHPDLVKTALFSAILPGSEQLLGGRYVKGGAFIATEVTTALVARFWYTTWKERIAEADDARQIWMQAAFSREDTLLAEEFIALKRFDAKSARYSMYNTLSWMIGAHIYNIADALKGTGAFTSDESRSALKAAWLSAIPGLGLGQIYNGELGKAGMIMMTQVSLGVIAVNQHRLMQRAQDHYTAVFSYKDTLGNTPVADKYSDEWDSKQKNAFRNRNSYLWYSLFFYFYGILDAVVDAHLHDYNQKMKVYPDLVPGAGSFGLNIDYNF